MTVVTKKWVFLKASLDHAETKLLLADLKRLIVKNLSQKLILEITKTPDLMSYSSTRSEFQNTKEDLEHWFKNNRH